MKASENYMSTTYRLTDIIRCPPPALPVYGPEGEPVRILRRNGDDADICCVRCDAGPATVGNLRAAAAAMRWGVPWDLLGDEGDDLATAIKDLGRAIGSMPWRRPRTRSRHK